MRYVRALLIAVAVVCFGVALSYPIRYRLAQRSNDGNMERLSALRTRAKTGAEEGAGPAEAEIDPTGPAEGDTLAPGVEDAGSPERPEGAAGDAGHEAAGVPDSGETGAAGGEAEASFAPEAETGTGAPEAPGAEPGEAEVAPGMPKRDPGAAEDEIQAAPAGPTSTPTEPAPAPIPTPGLADLILELPETPDPGATPEALAGPERAATPLPTPTPDRRVTTGALPYPMKERVMLDEGAILPELREIYALNRDLVGWLKIDGTAIDYPVVQAGDSEFYLSHDFYGEENVNGQIILDTPCDPYTPSYNLIISGHHMKNGSMFGNLPLYARRGYWEEHKLVAFDTLMKRQRYVVFATFYSADYDEDEEGFRYNADIRYAKEAEQWLTEIRANQLYDTGVDARFGDEFITLTTCDRERRRNGRFVVVCRKLREGETFE